MSVTDYPSFTITPDMFCLMACHRPATVLLPMTNGSRGAYCEPCAQAKSIETAKRAGFTPCGDATLCGNVAYGLSRIDGEGFCASCLKAELAFGGILDDGTTPEQYLAECVARMIAR